MLSSPGRLSAIVQDCKGRYNPDPDPSDPFYEGTLVPREFPDHHIEGYLNIRVGTVKKAWRRCFFSVESGVLLLVDRDSERIIMQLRDAKAMPAPIGDRRNTFVVQSQLARKQKIALQAESEREMQDWVQVITAASREPRIAVGRSSVYYSTRALRDSAAGEGKSSAAHVYFYRIFSFI